ncbi:hypothetical protein CW306_15465 [Bacillus sp. BA3]|nr:hypothetical protein CW306_15465 [Bacillus sp. BA3]
MQYKQVCAFDEMEGRLHQLLSEWLNAGPRDTRGQELLSQKLKFFWLINRQTYLLLFCVEKYNEIYWIINPLGMRR